MGGFYCHFHEQARNLDNAFKYFQVLRARHQQLTNVLEESSQEMQTAYQSFDGTTFLLAQHESTALVARCRDRQYQAFQERNGVLQEMRHIWDRVKNVKARIDANLPIDLQQDLVPSQILSLPAAFEHGIEGLSQAPAIRGMPHQTQEASRGEECRCPCHGDVEQQTSERKHGQGPGAQPSSGRNSSLHSELDYGREAAPSPVSVLGAPFVFKLESAAQDQSEDQQPGIRRSSRKSKQRVIYQEDSASSPSWRPDSDHSSADWNGDSESPERPTQRQLQQQTRREALVQEAARLRIKTHGFTEEELMLMIQQRSDYTKPTQQSWSKGDRESLLVATNPGAGFYKSVAQWRVQIPPLEQQPFFEAPIFAEVEAAAGLDIPQQVEEPAEDVSEHAEQPTQDVPDRVEQPAQDANQQEYHQEEHPHGVFQQDVHQQALYQQDVQPAPIPAADDPQGLRAFIATLRGIDAVTGEPYLTWPPPIPQQEYYRPVEQPAQNTTAEGQRGRRTASAAVLGADLVTGEPYFNWPPRPPQPAIQQPTIQQPNLRQPNLRQPNLRPPNLRPPNLRQPNLRQPNLRQPNLRQPNLRQPNLRQPNLRQAHVRQPNVRQPNERQPNAWQYRLILPRRPQTTQRPIDPPAPVTPSPPPLSPRGPPERKRKLKRKRQPSNSSPTSTHKRRAPADEPEEHKTTPFNPLPPPFHPGANVAGWETSGRYDWNAQMMGGRMGAEQMGAEQVAFNQGANHMGYGQTGYGQTGYGRLNEAQLFHGQMGYAQMGYGQMGFGQMEGDQDGNGALEATGQFAQHEQEGQLDPHLQNGQQGQNGEAQHFPARRNTNPPGHFGVFGPIEGYRGMSTGEGGAIDPTAAEQTGAEPPAAVPDAVDPCAVDSIAAGATAMNATATNATATDAPTAEQALVAIASANTAQPEQQPTEIDGAEVEQEVDFHEFLHFDELLEKSP